ncbi:MAG: ABC transporter substrate-binding protein [Eubacterium sp.]|nr:ABC transporter substrate-binding protein [Eubacterium sp.]MCI8918471.1 ABC transporter substrate-binding protein [Eubacterium sp.]
MKRKIIAVLMAVAMTVSLAACGSSPDSGSGSSSSESNESNEKDADDSKDSADGQDQEGSGQTADSGKVYNIGICQLVEHEALDAATKGFKDALIELLGEDKLNFEEQNAQNEQTNCATICNGFVSNNVDLILANATPALQSASAATNKIPILGTSVTDYATALGMSDFSGTTGTNISGTSDLAPIEQQEAMIRELFPDAKKVGIIYCSAEPNSKFQAEQMEAALEKDGISYEEFTASDSNEIQAVVTKACSSSDCLYVPTDNTMASSVSLLKDLALQYKMPIVAGEAGICEGGVATLSISYYDLGYATGKMAYEVLVNGADVSSMEIEYAEATTKRYNKEICEALGIKIPQGYEELE